MVNKKSKFGFILLLLVSSLFVTFQNFTPAPTVLRVYVAPAARGGLDLKGRGYDESQPIASLGQAHAIVSAELAKMDRPVEVIFHGGTYVRQTQVWKKFPKNYKIIFRPLNVNDEAAFDGAKVTNNFMTFAPTAAGPSNVEVRNLTFTRYLEGINFSAPNRDDVSKGISNNVIANNRFIAIGNMHAPILDKNGKKLLGMAVVRLVNTSHSQFIGNYFEGINNSDGNGLPTGGSLHAFYVAHNSSHNQFEGNVFRDHRSGSAIKIRDNSNENLIIANKFDLVSPQAIQVWHCEINERGTSAQSSNGCTKVTVPECYSHGNYATGNMFGGVSEKYSIYTSSRGTKCVPKRRDAQLVIDTKNYNGELISSIIGSSEKFAVCNSTDACVNASNKCFANLTGSAHLLCSDNSWESCGLKLVNKRVKDFTCTKTAKGDDAVWVKTVKAPVAPVTPATPAVPTKPVAVNGKYLIQSLLKGQMNQAYCDAPTSCVNDKKACFAHMAGSPTLLCNNQVWMSCAEKYKGKVLGNKVCNYSAPVNKYVWMNR